MLLTLEEFQSAALRTANGALSNEQALSNYALGLAGEAGEAADLIKKVLYHGKPLDLRALQLELGDVLYYVAVLAAQCGLSLTAVAEANVQKLKARFPAGFSTEAANARFDESASKK